MQMFSGPLVLIYASERSRYILSENGIVCYATTYCFGDIRIWSRRILLKLCWASNFFDTLVAIISWMVDQTL